MTLRFRQIHLDFHTSERIPAVGQDFDPDAFAQTLREAAVDSVTCFSRCHHGLIYHDTKFDARHPGLKTNLLPQMIEACHQRDIRVPVYVTVGFDEFQYQRHPEWQEIGPDGKPQWAGPLTAMWHKLCLNVEPYLGYVVAQTREMLDTVPADGVFFDIMLQGPCVCMYCLRGMQAEGIDPANQAARIAYGQTRLLAAKQRLFSAVRERSADCPVFFNSGHVSPAFRSHLDLFSHLEIESLPSGGWGYDHFPTTVRYARNLGLDTLGMTGRFHKMWGDFGGYKNPAALAYECYSALAEGSKCSVGDQLHPRGVLDPATYGLIGGVYRSVRDKEPWCVDARPVTEIAVFNPEAVGAQDAQVDSALAGAYLMLAEGKHQFDVVDGENDWSRYAVLILPDKIPLDTDLAAKVNAFVAEGGQLILSHKAGLNVAEGERFLVDEMPCEYVGEGRFCPDYVEPGTELAQGIAPVPHVMYDRGTEVSPIDDADILAHVWWPYFNREWDHFCSHLHAPAEERSDFAAALRRGRITYFAHPVFGMYKRHGNRICRQLVLNALARALPEPLIQSNAPGTARFSLLRQEDEKRHILHVLHYIPENRYGDVPVIEDVIPLHQVEVTLRLPGASRVQSVPDGAAIPHEPSPHGVRFTIPVVHGHAMVAIDD